jgi:uncharacterized protein YndB with AHSA1/START domain
VHSSVTIDVDAPPDRVWAVMVDVGAWPQWTASVTEAVRLDAGHFDVGSRVRLRQPRLPVAVWTVEDVEPGRSFTWTSGVPGFRSTGRHVVERRGDGSRVTLELEQRGVVGELVGRWMAGLVDRYVRLEAVGLKRRSEEPPAVA